MSNNLLLVDEFSQEAHRLRKEGLEAPYVDWQDDAGEIYKRVCPRHYELVWSRIEQLFGPVKRLMMGFRLNYGGELPNTLVHSDLGWGTHAMVLYLSDGPGGTAFWRHKDSGLEALYRGQVDELATVQADWNREEAWEQVGLAPLKFNRAAFYRGAFFHSRWPFAAFGKGPQDGRLTLVAFFTPTTP